MHVSMCVRRIIASTYVKAESKYSVLYYPKVFEDGKILPIPISKVPCQNVEPPTEQ
jgi:hypothetical protein